MVHSAIFDGYFSIFDDSNNIFDGSTRIFVLLCCLNPISCLDPSPSVPQWLHLARDMLRTWLGLLDSELWDFFLGGDFGTADLAYRRSWLPSRSSDPHHDDCPGPEVSSQLYGTSRPCRAWCQKRTQKKLLGSWSLAIATVAFPASHWGPVINLTNSES